MILRRFSASCWQGGSRAVRYGSRSSAVNGPGCATCASSAMHQRWPVLNDPNPRVAMTVDPPLMTLGQAKPSFKIEIVLDLLKLALADEKAGEEADHHRGHVLVNRVLIPLESVDQLLELLLPLRASLPSGFEGRGHLRRCP